MIHTAEGLDVFRTHHVAACGLACLAVDADIPYMYSTSLMTDVEGVPCELVVAGYTSDQGHMALTFLNHAWRKTGYQLGTEQRLTVTDVIEEDVSVTKIYTLREATEDERELFYTRDALTDDRDGYKVYMVTIVQ